MEKVRGDSFAALHTTRLTQLKQQLEREQDRMEAIRDNGMGADVTVVSFAPNGFWLAVCSRDGSMAIFSLKDLQLLRRRDDPGADYWPDLAESAQDNAWIPLWRHCLSLVDVDTRAFRTVRQAAGPTWCGSQGSRGVDLTAESVRGEARLEGLRGQVRQVGRCRGHTGSVLRCDWALDCLLLRTASSACELLYWEMPRGTHSNRAHEHRETRWATHTALFGWHLKAIFPAGSSGDSVHAVDVSRVDGPMRSVVTADSDGHVKLFRYPCNQSKACFRAYIGHAAQVRENLALSLPLPLGLRTDSRSLYFPCISPARRRPLHALGRRPIR